MNHIDFDRIRKRFALMNPNDFDHTSKRFADHRLTRRRALATGGAGIVASDMPAGTTGVRALVARRFASPAPAAD